MPGERWPDKRARAVLYAGANRLARDGAPVEPDRVAELGLQVRDLLFVDAEVREENADVKAHRIGYSADCMQFATLEPEGDGVSLALWLGVASAGDARDALGATDDPNPFRRLYGWVRVGVKGPEEVRRVAPWVDRAREHARRTKKEQDEVAARQGAKRAV